MSEYQFFAQPIENIRTKRIIVFELLLREWVPEKKEWLRPENFDLSSETLIACLDEAMQKLGPVCVSINLTNKQFSDPRIMAALTLYAHDHLLPRQLTIELVENPVFETLKRISVDYRAAGILLALDDVGSDNLYAHVKDMLPYLNTVKFAIQNLRKPGEPTTNRAIDLLHLWFNMAEKHQMLFTFEGIEGEIDIALATHLGITRGQGYYFSKPQPAEMFKDSGAEI